MSLPNPVTRKEQYLNEIATGEHTKPGYPVTREEMYLDAIAEGGGSGGTGYETITGNPLEFESPSPQMVGMKCDIEPSQDLHGYDKPWAGGEGKNKLPHPFTQTIPLTVYGVTITDNNGRLTINGTCTTGFNAILVGNSATVWGSVDNAKSLPVSNGNYTISGGDETAKIYINHYRNGSLLETYSIGIQPITISVLSTDLFEVSIRIVNSTTYNNLTISPQIEAGSSATSYAPYSNICPIAGVDTIDIDVAGGESYTIDLDGTRYGGQLDVTSGVLTLTY